MENIYIVYTSIHTYYIDIIIVVLQYAVLHMNEGTNEYKV